MLAVAAPRLSVEAAEAGTPSPVLTDRPWLRSLPMAYQYRGSSAGSRPGPLTEAHDLRRLSEMTSLRSATRRPAFARRFELQGGWAERWSPGPIVPLRLPASGDRPPLA